VLKKIAPAKIRLIIVGFILINISFFKKNVKRENNITIIDEKIAMGEVFLVLRYEKTDNIIVSKAKIRLAVIIDFVILYDMKNDARGIISAKIF